MKHSIVWLIALGVLAGLVGVDSANAASREDYQKLKKEIEAIRQQIQSQRPVGNGPVGRAEALVGNKYGPNAAVTTRQGNLKIGGLVQVWFYSIQNDNHSFVDKNQIAGAGAVASNEVVDNDSFRVRRAELRFTMDIHENVTAYVMLDAAREATSFPSLPQNQSSLVSGDGVAFFDSGAVGGGNIRNPLVRSGGGTASRLLQDAYINYHGILPHHDVTAGQFKRRLGEEGTRDSSKLDFVERSMITQLADLRDLGVQVHGFWFDDRLQYWVGAFDGAGTAFQQHQNRVNTNDNVDIVATILGRPLWKDEMWGSLELGYSIMLGKGGESGGRNAGAFPGVDGLNRNRTSHSLMYAWGMYKPAGPVRGWWIRGEWGQYRDRFAPNQVSVDPSLFSATTDPVTFTVQGWNVSTGYKLSESRWNDGLRNGGVFQKYLLQPMEFTFRYDVMANLFYEDLSRPTRALDVFKTQVFTAGINYYIKGNNAKLQVNYNVVVEEDNVDTGTRQVREVRNNSLIVNFQVAW